MIKDSTDIMPIFLWIGDWINVGRELLQHYKHASTKNEQILKTTLTSEVSSNMEVTAIDYDVYVSPNVTKIVAKVVAADLKTLAQTYLCSICNVSFSIENGLAWCNNCNNVSAQNACKSKAYLGSSILKDDDQSKLHIIFFHSIIERKFDLPLSNTAQKVIVCKLIKTFLFTIDRFNKCLEFVDNWQFHFITSW